MTLNKKITVNSECGRFEIGIVLDTTACVRVQQTVGENSVGDNLELGTELNVQGLCGSGQSKSVVTIELICISFNCSFIYVADSYFGPKVPSQAR